MCPVANYPVAEKLEEQARKAYRSLRPEAVRNLIGSSPTSKMGPYKVLERLIPNIFVGFLRLSSNLRDVFDLSHFSGAKRIVGVCVCAV